MAVEAGEDIFAGALPGQVCRAVPVSTYLARRWPPALSARTLRFAAFVLLVLSGVSPANAPQLIRSARELGYTGLISTETGQDASVLQEGAGELADGFISVGGASTPELASDAMREFVERYTKMFGEYNDESNTKVYALEYIIETLKANPAAIDNVDEFKKTMDTFEAANPFMKGDAKLKYVGMTSFGQKRQISVPLVVNEYKGGKFETLFVGQVD